MKENFFAHYLLVFTVFIDVLFSSKLRPIKNNIKKLAATVY